MKNQEFETQYQSIITQICGVARTTGRWGSGVYIGWTENGLPTVVTDDRYLNPEIKEGLKLSMASLRNAAEIPIIESATELVPVHFQKVLEPANFDETRDNRYDLLRFKATDGSGKTVELNVRELDFLNTVRQSAINKKCLIWQVINPNTLLREDVLPAMKMYTLLLPDASSQKQYAVLFMSKMKTESNSFAFKPFLKKSLSALLLLDSPQKGYYASLVEFLEEKGIKGGLASIIFSWIDRNVYDLPDSEIEALKIDSFQRRFDQQIWLILRDMGFLDENYLRRDGGLDDVTIDNDFSIDDLQYLAEKMFQRAYRSLR